MNQHGKNYKVTIYTDRSDPNSVGLAYQVRWYDADGWPVHEESGACDADGWEEAGREVSAAWLNAAELDLRLGQDGAWRAFGAL